MTENTKIKEWYYNNTKLYKEDDMIALEKYIEEMNIDLEEINISADYTFHYIADMIQHIRYENIFKLNFLNICKNLSEYFPKLEITCEFEKTSFTSWWHPVTGEIISEDKPLAMILRGILEEADQLWKNKFYFEAGGKYGLAKKLAKKDNYCQGIFNKHLKKQSFLMKLWTNLASIFSFF